MIIFPSPIIKIVKFYLAFSIPRNIIRALQAFFVFFNYAMPCSSSSQYKIPPDFILRFIRQEERSRQRYFQRTGADLNRTPTNCYVLRMPTTSICPVYVYEDFIGFCTSLLTNDRLPLKTCRAWASHPLALLLPYRFTATQYNHTCF